MKKSFLFVVFLAVGTIALLSWGVTGHRTVGKIAEDHLTPKALAGVRDLLGDATLADVSTWADEVRGRAEYRQTGSWHYINLPLGLNYDAFRSRVENMLEANVYGALAEQMRLITDKTVPREKKIDALKFVVHFVGDLHQPMHVSRAEDKGGNTIQLNYEGQGTNLHSVWDSKLIEQTGLDYQQLAQKYDHPTAAQVRQWQSDPVIKWIWESYEISSRLYAEVDTMHSRSIGEDYYKAHWPVVAQRLEQAGVRLAGVLNILFRDGPVTSGSAVRGAGAVAAGEPVKIDIRDAASHVDENVVVSGRVYGYKALDGLTLVNVGAAYPNQLLTLVLRGDAKDIAPGLDGKVITVAGKIELYKGKPEIAVRDPQMITQ
jgi:nuclease S1